MKLLTILVMAMMSFRLFIELNVTEITFYVEMIVIVPQIDPLNDGVGVIACVQDVHVCGVFRVELRLKFIV